MLNKETSNTPLSEVEGLPLSQSEAITSLASATSELARAVSKISYTPTRWVDNSEPDINAANLNKIEQGILQATTAINGAVDAINAINGNLGSIKYLTLSSNSHLNKPFEVIKEQWGDLEPDKIYLAKIFCGSEFIALIQTYGQLTHGSALITSYGLFKPIYAVLRNTTWTEYSLITNTDLTARFNPIEINGTKGDTFKNVLKNKCNNSVNFIVFNGSTENPISDNPFTSKNGYCIAFNSDRLNAYNYFILLGITKDIIETKIFDARS